MNPVKLTQELTNFITKTIDSKISNIFKNQQSIVATGTIVQIDYVGKRATVQIGGSTTGFIPYSRHFTSTQIGVGQSVLTVASDTNNLNSKVIVATLTDT